MALSKNILSLPQELLKKQQIINERGYYVQLYNTPTNYYVMTLKEIAFPFFNLKQ